MGTLSPSTPPRTMLPGTRSAPQVHGQTVWCQTVANFQQTSLVGNRSGCTRACGAPTSTPGSTTPPGTASCNHLILFRGLVSQTPSQEAQSNIGAKIALYLASKCQRNFEFSLKTVIYLLHSEP